MYLQLAELRIPLIHVAQILLWKKSTGYLILKLNSHLAKKIIWFNESTLKMIENVLYLILKAVFIFKIFKFLSWLFSYVETLFSFSRFLP